MADGRCRHCPVHICSVARLHLCAVFALGPDTVRRIGQRKGGVHHGSPGGSEGVLERHVLHILQRVSAHGHVADAGLAVVNGEAVRQHLGAQLGRVAGAHCSSVALGHVKGEAVHEALQGAAHVSPQCHLVPVQPLRRVFPWLLHRHHWVSAGFREHSPLVELNAAVRVQEGAPPHRDRAGCRDNVVHVHAGRVAVGQLQHLALGRWRGVHQRVWGSGDRQLA